MIPPEIALQRTANPRKTIDFRARRSTPLMFTTATTRMMSIEKSRQDKTNSYGVSRLRTEDTSNVRRRIVNTTELSQTEEEYRQANGTKKNNSKFNNFLGNFKGIAFEESKATLWDPPIENESEASIDPSFHGSFVRKASRHSANATLNRSSAKY